MSDAPKRFILEFDESNAPTFKEIAETFTGGKILETEFFPVDIHFGGPAFPILDHKIGWHGDIRQKHAGMSLRDWFAAQALASLAQHYPKIDADECARTAYRFADAMLIARAIVFETPEDAA